MLHTYFLGKEVFSDKNRKKIGDILMNVSLISGYARISNPKNSGRFKEKPLRLYTDNEILCEEKGLNLKQAKNWAKETGRFS